MTEIFYGPWQIVLVHANSHFAQSLVISGSDNADGRYDIAFGTALELHVRGVGWALQIQFFPFGGPQWQQGDTRRSTSFEPKKGLISRIECAARPPGTGPRFDNATFVCTCRDPETNPIPADNPYDFTLPG